mmetsp:Transcript_4112/g.8386  ORF Transcript_4112/g.8386 Transcript_4112/m.8386 type:complete len:905 (+) Transcript_4112:146-2860(+)
MELEQKYSTTSLFVGDLAQFCSESDLEGLFSQYGEIAEVRIMRNNTTKKPLCYGFVTFASNEGAQNALDRLNSVSFQGRNLRLGWAAHNFQVRKPEEPIVNSLYVRFSSPQIQRLVNEEALHEVFDMYSNVTDVSIKKLVCDEAEGTQSGYGFIHFSANQAGIASAFQALSGVHMNTIDTISFTVEASKNLLKQFKDNSNPPSRGHSRHSSADSALYTAQANRYGMDQHGSHHVQAPQNNTLRTRSRSDGVDAWSGPSRNDHFNFPMGSNYHRNALPPAPPSASYGTYSNNNNHRGGGMSSYGSSHGSYSPPPPPLNSNREQNNFPRSRGMNAPQRGGIPHYSSHSVAPEQVHSQSQYSAPAVGAGRVVGNNPFHLPQQPHQQQQPMGVSSLRQHSHGQAQSVHLNHNSHHLQHQQQQDHRGVAHLGLAPPRLDLRNIPAPISTAPLPSGSSRLVGDSSDPQSLLLNQHRDSARGPIKTSPTYTTTTLSSPALTHRSGVTAVGGWSPRVDAPNYTPSYTPRDSVLSDTSRHGSISWVDGAPSSYASQQQQYDSSYVDSFDLNFRDSLSINNDHEYLDLNHSLTSTLCDSSSSDLQQQHQQQHQKQQVFNSARPPIMPNGRPQGLQDLDLSYLGVNRSCSNDSNAPLRSTTTAATTDGERSCFFGSNSGSYSSFGGISLNTSGGGHLSSCGVGSNQQQGTGRGLTPTSNMASFNFPSSFSDSAYNATMRSPLAATANKMHTMSMVSILSDGEEQLVDEDFTYAGPYASGFGRESGSHDNSNSGHSTMLNISTNNPSAAGSYMIQSPVDDNSNSSSINLANAGMAPADTHYPQVDLRIPMQPAEAHTHSSNIAPNLVTKSDESSSSPSISEEGGPTTVSPNSSSSSSAGKSRQLSLTQFFRPVQRG